MIRDEYLTSTEAAEIMMCSRTYVVSLIKEGRLPAYKVGNRNYIPKSAVRKHIEQNTYPAVTCGTSEQRINNVQDWA